MLSGMPSLWKRVTRAVLIFGLAGLCAGYLVASRDESLGIGQILVHPMGYQSAIAGLIGGLAWSPLLSWPRLWGHQTLDLGSDEIERKWMRRLAIILSITGMIACTQRWILVEDNGVARLNVGDNSERLKHWHFDRVEEGTESRYRWVRVTPIAPLPLVAGANTPAVSFLGPGSRAMIGTVGQVVFAHADAEVAKLTQRLRTALVNDGVDAFHGQIREVDKGIQVLEQTIDYQPDDELGPFPYMTSEAIQQLGESDVTPVLQLDHQHQFIQKLDSRNQYAQSELSLNGIFTTGGMLGMASLLAGVVFVWLGRMGMATLIYASGLGALLYSLWFGVPNLTIQVQPEPDGPLEGYVLAGSLSPSVGFATLTLLLALLASSYGSTTAPLWARRLSKSTASMLVGAGAGLTSCYIYVELWQPMDNAPVGLALQLILVSFWKILVPASCSAGILCAWWNSRGIRKTSTFG